MGDRVPYVVGILAIAAVVAWLVLRDDNARPAATPASQGSSAATGPDQATPATTPPSLPDPGSFGSTAAPPPELPDHVPTADDVFAEETRDDAWAVKTETELTRRWKQIRAGKLESTECRATQCRLVVTGNETDVAQAVADLEGPRGLHGYAKGVLLTSPSKHDDGTVALRVFVRFDR